MLIQKTVSFQNKPLTYYTGGNGPVLVFLHGFCEDHTVWNGFIDPFFSTYKIIAPDFPGFGTSAPVEALSMTMMADFVKSILDAEGITRCILIGHSMGGYVSMDFAKRFSFMLDGLVLFHSTAYADSEEKKQDRKRVADLVLKNGYEKFAADIHDVLFGDSFKEKHPHIVQQMKDYAVKNFTTEGVAAASLAMGNREDTSEVLKSFLHPVFFIIGKNDKAVPPEKTLPLVTFPAISAVQILGDAAHMGMIEQPALTRQALRGFLDLCFLKN